MQRARQPLIHVYQPARLAIKAKGDLPRFFEDLDSKLDLVIDQLWSV
jgi:hypothetical protein